MRKIGIICAGDEELEPFLRRMGKTAVSQKAMLSFHEGRAAGFSAAALFCGVGKVNAAAATQILIDDYGVDAVINAGTAGGMDESVGLFDTIVAETTFYHDVDDGILTEFHPWLPAARFEADPLLLAAAGRVCRRNAKVRRGLIVTGDRFVDGGMRSLLNREYAPLAADMETAAVAHVCHVNAIPFLAVRCITDTSVCPGQDAFEKNCARASEIAADIVFEILRELTVIVFVDRNDVAEQFFRQNGSVRNNVEVFDFRLHQRGIVTERFKRLRGNALVGLSGTAGLKRQCRVTNAFGHNVSPLKKCFLLFTAYEVIGGPPFSSAAYTKDIKTKRRPLPLIFRI